MGFSGSVNGTTQFFWILVFANVNGPIHVLCEWHKCMKVTVTTATCMCAEQTFRINKLPRKIHSTLDLASK